MKPEIRATIKFALSHFANEITFYTVEGVKETAHTPHGAQQIPDTWVDHLIAYLDDPALSKDVANADELKESLISSKSKLKELARTLTALHCYRMCQERNYPAFVEAQSGLKDQLTQENFGQLCDLINKFTPDNDTQEVLGSLIVISDLGKSPKVRELAALAGIDRNLDNDDLMLEILELPDDEDIEKILPFYKNMGASAKAILVTSYRLMTACFGHLIFMETTKVLHAIAGALAAMPRVPELREKVLALAFAAQFLDAAGSNGQTFMYGARVFTNDFYRMYMFMLDTMQVLNSDLYQLQEAGRIGILTGVHAFSEERFLQYYETRAKMMGLDRKQFTCEEDFYTVLRLACMLRVTDRDIDKAAVQALTKAFYSLSDKHRTLLTEQLNPTNSQGLNLVAHAPNYVATGVQNICKIVPGDSLKPERIQDALNYSIVMARLVEKLWQEHPAVLEDELLPLNFGGLAALANDPANFSDPDAFDLDALLAKEPILPPATVRRLEAPTEKLKAPREHGVFKEKGEDGAGIVHTGIPKP